MSLESSSDRTDSDGDSSSLSDSGDSSSSTSSSSSSVCPLERARREVILVPKGFGVLLGWFSWGSESFR